MSGSPRMKAPPKRPRRKSRRPIWILVKTCQSNPLHLTTCEKIIPPSARLVKLARTVPSCVLQYAVDEIKPMAVPRLCGREPPDRWRVGFRIEKSRKGLSRKQGTAPGQTALRCSCGLRGLRYPAPSPGRATALPPLPCQSVRQLLPRPALLPTGQGIGAP
jgi:hypothetical protein